MKVLHVITGLASGGAERQLALLLKHLPDECDVVCLTNPGLVADRMRADGFRVHNLGMTSNRDVTAVRRLAAVVKTGRYDLVHTHLYRAGLYGRLAARLAGVRAIVATEHSLGATQIEGRPKDRPGVRGMYRAAERLGSTTIAVSPAVRRLLIEWGVDAGRIEVIPNGIDADAFRYDSGLRDLTRKALGIAEDAFVVGGVGRLEPGKRFGVLIEAVAAIEDAVLLLVGAGSERAGLERLAKAGASDRVVFAGETDNVTAMLCAMDVFASPSTEETFGLAILEAVACGLPVVYADSPALEDIKDIEHPGRSLRAASEAPAFRAAVTAAGLLSRDRHVPAASLSSYGIAEQATRISELYRRILCGPVPSKESHV